MTLVIKNTFLDIADESSCTTFTRSTVRRSSSVPAAWRTPTVACSEAAFPEISDASTAAESDGSISSGAGTPRSSKAPPPCDQEVSSKASLSDHEDISSTDGSAVRSPEIFYIGEDISGNAATEESSAAPNPILANGFRPVPALPLPQPPPMPKARRRTGPCRGAAKRLNALDLCIAPVRKKVQSRPDELASVMSTSAGDVHSPVVANDVGPQTSSGASTEYCGLVLTSIQVADETLLFTLDDSDIEEGESTTAPEQATEDVELGQCGPTAASAKVPLQLSIHIPEEVPPRRTPLASRLRAKAFKPGLASGLNEAVNVIAAAKMALAHSPGISVVEEPAEAHIGTTLTICAQVCPSATVCQLADALESSKAAILAGCALTSSVYTLGYLTQPFEDAADEDGFSCALGFVPAACEDSACWDTFQKGFCPRRATCRWCHPDDSDLLRLHIKLKWPSQFDYQ